MNVIYYYGRNAIERKMVGRGNPGGRSQADNA
jgi:hypothetical protein